MTLRSFFGPPIELPPMLLKGSTSLGNQPVLMDAASEQVHMVGEIILQGGPGSSKLISSAGGKIHWRTGAATWATAGSTVRVGIQDVSTATSPAQGVGTFDVYADLVQGVDSIAANTAQATAMVTGSKTLTHGQLIAVAWNMSTRNGADLVNVQTNTPSYGSPAYDSPVVMLGTPTFVRQSGAPCFIIEFDDGTIGWFITSACLLGGQGTVAFNVSTALFDEYGNLFSVPFPVRALGITSNINIGTAAADFELCLYSDPLNVGAGVTLIDKVVVDATQLGVASGTGVCAKAFTNSNILKPGVTYAISIRPTTANSITTSWQDVSMASHWMAMGLSADQCYSVRRLDNTGAFSDYNGGTAQTRRLNLSLLVDQFNDQAGSANYLIGI